MNGTTEYLIKPHGLAFDVIVRSDSGERVVASCEDPEVAIRVAVLMQMADTWNTKALQFGRVKMVEAA